MLSRLFFIGSFLENLIIFQQLMVMEYFLYLSWAVLAIFMVFPVGHDMVLKKLCRSYDSNNSDNATTQGNCFCLLGFFAILYNRIYKNGF